MQNDSRYWRRTRRFTAILVALWFLLSFGTIFFARELSGLRFFGWPLSFYLLAQGLILFYAALIAFYAWRMERMETMGRQQDDHAE